MCVRVLLQERQMLREEVVKLELLVQAQNEKIVSTVTTAMQTLAAAALLRQAATVQTSNRLQQQQFAEQ